MVKKQALSLEDRKAKFMEETQIASDQLLFNFAKALKSINRGNK